MFKRTLKLLSIGVRMHVRSAMTIIIICLGYCICAFIFSVLWAGHSSYKSIVANSGSDKTIVVLSKNAPSITQSLISASDRDIALTEIAKDIGNANIGFISQEATFIENQGCDLKKSSLVRPHTPSVNSYNSDIVLAPQQIILGSDVSNACDLSGKKVKFSGHEFEVLRIVPRNFDVSDNMIFMNPSRFRTMYERGQTINAIRISIVTQNYSEELEALLSKKLKNFDVTNEREYYDNISGQLFLPTLIIMLEVGGLLLLGSFVASVLSMSITIHSRERELTILHFMGFSKDEIKCALALEGSIFALLASLIGLIVQKLLFSYKTFNVLDATSGGQISIHLTISILASFIIVLFQTILCFIGTYFLVSRFVKKMAEDKSGAST